MKRPFYPEFMEKHWTMPPRYICRTKADQIVGRVSPSLYWLERMTGDHGNEIMEYELKIARWCVYKRTASRRQWEMVWRDYRRRHNENPGT